MTGGFATGSATTGGLFINRRFIAGLARYHFVAKNVDVEVLSDSTKFTFRGIDGIASQLVTANPSLYRFIIDQALINVTTDTPKHIFIGALADVDVETTKSLYSFTSIDALINRILTGESSTYEFYAVDGDSFATGQAERTGLPSSYIFKSVDGVPSYNINVDRVPDFIATRVGNIITFNVRDRQETPVIIFKAIDAKANFTELGVFETFPQQETESREVKYKAAYSFQGQIGNDAISIIGQRSQSINTAKEDE